MQGIEEKNGLQSDRHSFKEKKTQIIYACEGTVGLIF